MEHIQIFRSVNRFRNMCRTFRYIHSTSGFREEQKRPKKKVREDTELITLVDSTDKVLGIKSKSDSVNLARKHRMMLEKVEVHKFGNTYPVFKLVSAADIVTRGEKKGGTANRDIKKISISNRITDHDLEVKVKMVKRLLGKNCEIHVTVTGSPEETNSMEVVYKKFHKQLEKEARILDKRLQGSALKFIVIPPKAPKEKETDKTGSIS